VLAAHLPVRGDVAREDRRPVREGFDDRKAESLGERGAHGAPGRATYAYDLEFLVDSGLEQGLQRARRKRRFGTATLAGNRDFRFHLTPLMG